MHPMELLDEVYQWNLASVQLEIVLVSVQDSCMVCAQCTIGSEIVVEVPDGTPR
jgi:hypothetical protein